MVVGMLDVGIIVGEIVGIALGLLEDGVKLGSFVGEALGRLVGIRDDGSALGNAVGDAVGISVGTLVGLLDGRALDGREDGDAVAAVGAVDGGPHTRKDSPTASTAFPTCVQSLAVIFCDDMADTPLKKSGSNKAAPTFNEHKDFTRAAKSFI
jgi:hypothetical protein